MAAKAKRPLIRGPLKRGALYYYYLSPNSSTFSLSLYSVKSASGNFLIRQSSRSGRRWRDYFEGKILSRTDASDRMNIDIFQIQLPLKPKANKLHTQEQQQAGTTVPQGTATRDT